MQDKLANVVKILLDYAKKCQNNSLNDQFSEYITLHLPEAGIDFTDINLTNINLSNTNLSNLILCKAKLMEADLSGAILHNTNIENANITGCKGLTLDQLIHANFTKLIADGYNSNIVIAALGHKLQIQNERNIKLTSKHEKTKKELKSQRQLVIKLIENIVSQQNFIGGNNHIDKIEFNSPVNQIANQFQYLSHNTENYNHDASMKGSEGEVTRKKTAESITKFSNIHNNYKHDNHEINCSNISNSIRDANISGANINSL